MICALLPALSYGQSDGTLTFEDSDPEALERLEAMDAYITGLGGFTAKFSMTMAIPGSDTIMYNGTLDQLGNQYRIDVRDYLIISDGITRWVYYDEVNEVNLYNEAGSEDGSSPLSYLRMYKSGDFVLRIADEYAIREDQSVELKPLDRSSDYSKVRLTIDGKTFAPKRIEVFEKGGTRTDLRIDSIEKASNFPNGHFVFNAEDHPEVRVEDLRLD